MRSLPCAALYAHAREWMYSTRRAKWRLRIARCCPSWIRGVDVARRQHAAGVSPGGWLSVAARRGTALRGCAVSESGRAGASNRLHFGREAFTRGSRVYFAHERLGARDRGFVRSTICARELVPLTRDGHVQTHVEGPNRRLYAGRCGYRRGRHGQAEVTATPRARSGARSSRWCECTMTRLNGDVRWRGSASCVQSDVRSEYPSRGRVVLQLSIRSGGSSRKGLRGARATRDAMRGRATNASGLLGVAD